ncbi:MAG: tetratricopeptide repeat protein [Stellaceae bacterium]
MKRYWISFDFPTEKSLSRQLSHILQKELIPPVLHGAIERIEEANRQRLQQMQRTQIAPNIYFFTGAPAIGRRTSAKGFVQRLFKNDLYWSGPEILLDDPASIEDLYFRSKEEFTTFSKSEYEQELQWYRNISEEKRIDELVEGIKRISASNQTIYLICQTGLFDEHGYLIRWAKTLFNALSASPSTRLAIVSTRQPRSEEISLMPHVFWYHVKELRDEYVISIVQEITQERLGKLYEPTKEHLLAIGGHPLLARAYANLICQYGEIGDADAVGQIAQIQRHLMSEFLSYDRLLDEEKVVLTILSWVPRLSAEALSEILTTAGINNYSDAIKTMIRESLVNLSETYYAIAAPVRYTFRQLHGFGYETARKAIADYYRLRLASGTDIGSELVDSALFVISLEKGAVPEEFRNILSPSTVLRIAQELYRDGRANNKSELFARVVSLTTMAKSMKTERDIAAALAVVRIRSLLKLKKFQEADVELRSLEADGSRQAILLRAQYFRHLEKWRDAINWFERCLSSGLNTDAIIHEYCTCLRKMGEFKKIGQILEKFSTRTERNVFLLDLRAAFQLGNEDFLGADKTIKKMRAHLDDNFMSWTREGILIARSTQDYPRAEQVLTEGIDRAIRETGRAPGELYSTRCVLRCKMKLVPAAIEDSASVRQTHRNAEQVCQRLQVHILAAKGEYDEALAAIEAIPNRTSLDLILKRDVLLLIVNDIALPGFKREAAQKQLSVVLPNLVKLTEFDVVLE